MFVRSLSTTPARSNYYDMIRPPPTASIYRHRTGSFDFLSVSTGDTSNIPDLPNADIVVSSWAKHRTKEASTVSTYDIPVKLQTTERHLGALPARLKSARLQNFMGREVCRSPRNAFIRQAPFWRGDDVNASCNGEPCHRNTLLLFRLIPSFKKVHPSSNLSLFSCFPFNQTTRTFDPRSYTVSFLHQFFTHHRPSHK